jgi:hypothetical protein
MVVMVLWGLFCTSIIILSKHNRDVSHDKGYKIFSGINDQNGQIMVAA